MAVRRGAEKSLRGWIGRGWGQVVLLIAGWGWSVSAQFGGLAFAGASPLVSGGGSSATTASGNGGTGSQTSPPYLAVVTAPQVMLRAGPSDHFPETGTLQAGMLVWVDHEEANGWLAVQDPPQTLRCISWVPMQFINFDKSRPIPQNVVVDEGGAPLRPGKIGLAEPLPVQRTRVPGGTILLVIGPPVQREGRTWYPVAAPPGDFRYLPKQAVQAQRDGGWNHQVREPTPAVTPGAAASSSIPAPAPAADNAGSSGPARPPPVQHPLWQQAEAAEQAGRFDEAERLFFELARVLNEQGNHHDLANLCYTRIHALREKRRQSLPASPSGSSAPVRLLPKDTPPATASTSAGTTPTAPTDSARWYGPGRLVRSAIALDGRKTYALETHPGVPLVYVVPGAAGDLDRYVNSMVQVYGTAQSRRGLSYPYVAAVAVSPVPR